MSNLLIRLCLVVLIGLFSGISARAGQENVMVVLDASGSMWGQIDGTPKIKIARQVMSKVLGDLDGKANIGVLTYGHRRKGDCGDIETIIPVGKVNQRQYMSVINELSPKGKTPITEAVRQAARELRFTEEKATVVLISDGLETCQADPCALAKDLERQGVDFTVHVIGFDLSREDTSKLQCLAKETGGRYLAADNADELNDAFGQVVAQNPKPVEVPQVAPKPVDELASIKIDVLLVENTDPIKTGYVYIIPEADGKNKKKAVSSGGIGRTYKVKPGNYYVEAKIERIIASANGEVIAGQDNRVTIVLNAGLLSVKASADEGGKPLDQAYVTIYENEKQVNGKRKLITSGNQRKTFTLLAGKYYAVAKVGKAIVGQGVEVKAGEKTDTLIVLASGLLKVSVLAKEGGKPTTSGAYVYVYENDKQLNGKRKAITAGNPRNQFPLPAGKYYVVAKIGKASVGQEIEVTAGKLTQASIVVGVGGFKATVIPVAGGKPLTKAYMYIFEKEKQLNGKRKRITSANQRQLFKLPAGEYFVSAKIDLAKVAQEVVIKAGALTETTFVVNAGALIVSAAKRTSVTVFSAEKNLDGKRDRVGHVRLDTATMIPAGKYVLSGKFGSKKTEVEVVITAGKLKEVTLNP